MTDSLAEQADCPQVSIVIPVHNAEKTLPRLLDSLQAQTYQAIEMIFVNDGSTDRSEKLIQDRGETDPRIRCITHENSGVAISRNIGMELARGSYLLFADADDWLDVHAVERFLYCREISGCDLVVSDFYRILGEKSFHIEGIAQGGILSRKQFAEEMMKSPADFYYGVVWNKLFRLDLIRKHHLRFSPHLDWCEDFQFNLEYLQYAKWAYILKEPVYFYVKTKGSLSSHSATRGKIMKTKLELFQYYKQLYQGLELYEQNVLKIHAFLIAVAKDKRRRETPAECAPQ